MADTRTQPKAGAELPDVDLAAGVPGGVTAVIRNLDGRRVVWIEFEESETAPPLRSPMTDVMLTGAQAALEERLPLVMVVNSAGADIAEGIAPLHGWGRVARVLTRCSGVVPTFAIVDGPAVSGPALILGLVDFTVMTERSYAFVNGPLMVRQFTGVDVTKDELGSAGALDRNAGLPCAVAPDREGATH
ncbi:MAG: carboxyl transferase domain-containing protein, partial [Ilumatobacteraceae bacterium]